MVVLDRKQNQCLQLLKKGENLLVSGPGGSGKSTLIRTVIRWFEKRGKNVGVTATTGSASVLIGGTTIHSYLGIGLGDQTKMDLLMKLQKSPKRTNWTKTDLLIVDEVSMLSPELFDKLFWLGQQLRNDQRPFGGMQILLSGDFLQLPVVKCDKFVFEAKNWERTIKNIFLLSQVKRQSNPEFRDLLNRLRVGNGTDGDFAFLKSLGAKKEKDMEVRPTKLFCKNEDVDVINIKKLNELNEEIYKYELDVEIPEDAPSLPNNFNPAKRCNAPQIVRLCKGAEVLLLYNLNIEGGLVNGSRGTVTGFSEDKMPIVRFLNGIEITIGYTTWEIKEGRQVIALVTQIPLRLAYAITIHKSQGMSLDSAFINLSGVFEYGQAYVALSRVKSPDNLIVKNATKSSFKVHPKAKQFYQNLGIDDDDEPEGFLELYFDGVSKSNPGPASIGCSIIYNNEEVATVSEEIGEASNNVAEYKSLIKGLTKAYAFGKNIKVYGDSQLVINQMIGKYKVKNDDMIILNQEANNLCSKFDHVEFKHIMRELNKRAVFLANAAFQND